MPNVAAVVAALAFAAPAAAGVTSRYEADTLYVSSDGDDAIAVACVDGAVLVNGRAPDSGALPCSAVSTVVAAGGPGPNRIDLSRITPVGRTFRGIGAFAFLSGGRGDDVLVGPRGPVLAQFDGGSGSDRLEGLAVDKYVFGPAAATEVDTVVETPGTRCDPAYADIEQPGVTWWSVPWDVIDFSKLPAADPVNLALGIGGGSATHANRRIHVVGGPISVDAVAGGAGNDTIVGVCLALGHGGDDRLVGSVFDGDYIDGGMGSDDLAGLGGADKLDGGAGNDTLKGGGGTDELIGGRGDDVLDGGTGGDVFQFYGADLAQQDRVVEPQGSGLDVLSFDFPADAPARVDLRSAVLGHASGTVVRAARRGRIEGVIGGAGNDRVVGDGRANEFWGGGGDDVVIGLGGDDVYHVDWLGSMPPTTYEWAEVVGSLLEGWPSFHGQRAPAGESSLTVVERARGGRDTLDLAEIWAEGRTSGMRLAGEVRSGALVDLRARRWIVRADPITVAAGAPGTAANLENVRGTLYADTIVGNDVANVLEGRFGRDRVDGGRGRDTCVVEKRGADRLRACERVRRANPDR